eukprot:Sspe_Gene.44937::Locus_22119_Transcript_1_1_Confidence_1.000_Length_1459::g.44937::m.44937/K11426/SMYD; SET and MYND domain-containing protein
MEEGCNEETIRLDIDRLHDAGKQAFRKGCKKEADELFTRALLGMGKLGSAANLDQKATLYSNRSACRLATDPDLAAYDAQQAISIKPDWLKASWRMGCALLAMGSSEARKVLQKAKECITDTSSKEYHDVVEKLASAPTTGEALVQHRPTTAPPPAERTPKIPSPWGKRIEVAKVDGVGGRMGVLAAVDLKAGDIVLCEDPMICFSIDENSCAVCCAKVDRLLSCEVCGYEYYCSEECRSRAKEQWHAAQCVVPGGCKEVAVSKRLQRHYSLLRLSYVELSRCFAITVAARLHGLLATNPSHPTIRAFQRLARLTDDADQEVLSKYPQSFETRLSQFDQLQEILCPRSTTLGDPPYDFAWYRDLWMRVAANAIDICTDPENEICALLEVGSFFNHSCDPNVVHMSSAGRGRPTVMFKTTRAVAKGEELCISYIDTDQDTGQRQELLQQMYYFRCQCPKCSPPRK